MTTFKLRNYLAQMLNDERVFNGTSAPSPSISVFPGPESRNTRTQYVGGPECNDFKKLPVNILVRWSDDTDVSYAKAKQVYDLLIDKGNFTFESADIAYIQMLDDEPIWLGRDDSNIVEYTIRADIYFFTK